MLASLQASLEEFEFGKVLESVASIVQALEGDRVIEPLLVSSSSLFFSVVRLESLYRFLD